MFSRMWPHHLYSILAKYLFPLLLHLVFQEHKPQQGHIQMTESGDQTHPNYFQEAIAEQAAAVATAAQRNQARRSDDANIPQFPFPGLDNFSSSDPSTASCSSSGSSGSHSSVSGVNLARPTFQSMGPHVNIPFDL